LWFSEIEHYYDVVAQIRKQVQEFVAV
jgi:hypothetical protein